MKHTFPRKNDFSISRFRKPFYQRYQKRLQKTERGFFCERKDVSEEEEKELFNTFDEE
tara:strand:- start:87 stop:260 length:174 start_codon:yes stop_codon:yes gene_type:complete